MGAIEQEKAPKRTLAELLDADDEQLNKFDSDNVQIEDEDEELAETFNPDYCIDCQHNPIEIKCLNCDESFCRVCFQFVHKGGARKRHKIEELVKLGGDDDKKKANGKNEDDEGDEVLPDADLSPAAEDQRKTALILEGIKRNVNFIPLRLNGEERQLLRLLEAALNVSEYTDRVDILSYKSKTKRIVEQLREMCSILAGLVVSSNMKLGQKLIEDKNFEDNAEWYQTVFEVGRRYKIMNPERMRDTFDRSFVLNF
ncbi:unnamed protein product [Ambrosiozyma monospora]|uniref:Unnamed protein product n=1 Tax=Ambrosiozyma monospora TaxID=43982 RepID=A0ACB5T151_AMBMO|nr:unnamed protein product [Ambrosiozyma monospora]